MNKNLLNPVNDYYLDHSILEKKHEHMLFTNSSDLLKFAPTVKKNMILVNTTNETRSTDLNVNVSCPTEIELIMVLNITFINKARLIINGRNCTFANMKFDGGDSTYNFPSHIILVEAPGTKLINLHMDNVKCANSDLDYIRVKTKASEFEMHNSLMDGKSCNGVFLRLDFPLNHVIKNCVFRNFKNPGSSNGGETIRLATSDFENKDASCVIDSCLFQDCEGDPEIVSVKCSSNTIKNCVFENKNGQKLVLRHASRCIVDNCVFGDDSGIRVYGLDHKITNIQLLGKSEILLDNKSGNYVVSRNCFLENIYHEQGTPVINRSVNSQVKNIVKGVNILKSSLFTSNTKTTPSPMPKPTPIEPTLPDVPPAKADTNVKKPVGVFKLIRPKSVEKEIKESIIIKCSDQFNVEYVHPTIKSCTFRIKNNSNETIDTKTENIKPFNLFGDSKNKPRFETFNVPGKYIIEVEQTSESIVIVTY
jgi:hypothetical protein